MHVQIAKNWGMKFWLLSNGIRTHTWWMAFTYSSNINYCSYRYNVVEKGTEVSLRIFWNNSKRIKRSATLKFAFVCNRRVISISITKLVMRYHGFQGGCIKTWQGICILPKHFILRVILRLVYHAKQTNAMDCFISMFCQKALTTLYTKGAVKWYKGCLQHYKTDI